MPRNDDEMTRWKPSRKQRRILLVLLSGASNLGGLTVAQAAQAGPGTVYVLLHDLERMGYMTTSKETVPPGQDRRPRWFYRLTPAGRRLAMGKLGLKEQDDG